ncbi:hypothetical protein LAZ67_4001962 [Cordylochernes scorpioides]|uniref:CCHC-type domain-containing protein n=1 Tax=Cordylochernes scorpioides TaxID=51811 RepID=A0ABY6KFH7_9ARAC|nr:hypothetical protein LAZ67_4001962 [Cordylochernes scorpioides]
MEEQACNANETTEQSTKTRNDIGGTNQPFQRNDQAISPQKEIFTEETPPQGTSADPLANTARQRQEQAVCQPLNDTAENPTRHGNRAAMWPKPCDKFSTFDLTTIQCSRRQAAINFGEVTSFYKSNMERLPRQQENNQRSSLLTEPSSKLALPSRQTWAEISEDQGPVSGDDYTVVQNKRKRRNTGAPGVTAAQSNGAGSATGRRRSSPTWVPRVQEIRTTRAHIAEARARQASCTEEQCFYLEYCPDFQTYQYLKAILRVVGGPRGIVQMTKMNGHYLVGLANRSLAERLIRKGLEVEGTLLKTFPFRKRSFRITIGNLPFFVKDAAVMDALSQYGRITSIAPKQLRVGEFDFTDGRREAFILLHDGITLDKLPTRFEVKINGEPWPAFLSYGIKSSRCNGQDARAASPPSTAPRPSTPAPPASSVQVAAPAPPPVTPAPEDPASPRSAATEPTPPARPDFIAPCGPLPTQGTLGPATHTPDVDMTTTEETSASSPAAVIPTLPLPAPQPAGPIPPAPDEEEITPLMKEEYMIIEICKKLKHLTRLGPLYQSGIRPNDLKDAILLTEDRVSLMERLSPAMKGVLAEFLSAGNHPDVSSDMANLGGDALIPNDCLNVNPAAARGDVTSSLVAASSSNSAAHALGNWADCAEDLGPGADDGFTVVKSRKRRRCTFLQHQKCKEQSPNTIFGGIGAAGPGDNNNQSTAPNCSLRALDRMLGGTAGVIQISKVNGHQLLGLANRGLAERLISEGLEVEGTLLRAFPFRKRAERITVGNLPFFVEDSAIIIALKPYGRLTSIAPKMMKAGPYIYSDGRREAFIVLRDGVTTERLPARLEITIKGEAWPAYLSSGIKCSRCHGQGHRRANCPLLAGRVNTTRSAPPASPAGVPPSTAPAPLLRSPSQHPAPAPPLEISGASLAARAATYPVGAPQPSPTAPPALPTEETPPAPSTCQPTQEIHGPANTTHDVEMTTVEESISSSASSIGKSTRSDLVAFIKRSPSVSFAGTDTLGLGREEVLDLLSSKSKEQKRGHHLTPPQSNALADLINQILDLRPGGNTNIYKVLGQVRTELKTTLAAVPPTPPLPAEPTPPAPQEKE